MDASQQAELTHALEDDEKEREKAEGLRDMSTSRMTWQASARLTAAQQEVEQLQTVLWRSRVVCSVLGLQDEAVKFALQCLVDIKGKACKTLPMAHALRIAD